MCRSQGTVLTPSVSCEETLACGKRAGPQAEYHVSIFTEWQKKSTKILRWIASPPLLTFTAPIYFSLNHSLRLLALEFTSFSTKLRADVESEFPESTAKR